MNRSLIHCYTRRSDVCCSLSAESLRCK